LQIAKQKICNLKLINGFLGVLSDLGGEIKADLR